MNKKSFLCKSVLAFGFAFLMASCSGNSDSKSDKDSTNIENTEEVAVESDEVESSEDGEPSEASGDMDEVLNEYEKLIDDYIAMTKKVKSGDMTAMADCASLLKQANTTQEKLEAAKGDMTPAQAKRLTELIGKLAKAAGDLM